MGLWATAVWAAAALGCPNFTMGKQGNRGHLVHQHETGEASCNRLGQLRPHHSAKQRQACTLMAPHQTRATLMTPHHPAPRGCPPFLCHPTDTTHVFRPVGRALHGADAHVGRGDDHSSRRAILDERDLQGGSGGVGQRGGSEGVGQRGGWVVRHRL